MFVWHSVKSILPSCINYFFSSTQQTEVESPKITLNEQQQQAHFPAAHEVLEKTIDLESMSETSQNDRFSQTISPTPVIRRTRARATVSDRLISHKPSTSGDSDKNMGEEKAATIIQVDFLKLQL